MRSASSALWAFVFAIAFLSFPGCATAPPRESTPLARKSAAAPQGSVADALFDEGWKFIKGDDAKASDPAFDDTAWRTLDLPHDWSIESSFDSSLASCTAFLPCGTAWYRKTFSVPADAKDKSIRIRFDGIMNHSTIWCNGTPVGGRPYGYSSFTCDLTPVIKIGGENVLAVRVNHELYADSRWYDGSGIYRNVFLGISDKVHVDTNGTFVTTTLVTSASANVHVQTTIKNDSSIDAHVAVTTLIKDADGQTVFSTEQNTTVSAEGQMQVAATGTIDHPALWSPDHPNMYSTQTQLKKGATIVDEYTTPIGIRTFKFDADTGFSLNGQSMKIKGVCIHQDAGALGDVVPVPVWTRRLTLLKEAGCNAIRCSHNPPAPEFLDLCDSMGFLVMDEAFDEWTGGKKKWLVGHDIGIPGTDGYHSDFDQWADTDIHDMIVRDRNHPSIILWSIGNEIDYRNDPWPLNSPELPPIAARLIKDVKAVDITRPVTAACAFPAGNLYKPLLDVEGYNYMERLYAADHAANPTHIIYGSENNHAFTAWQAVTKNDFIAGQFLWTGIDYLGEAGVWPSHASGAGLLSLAGFPKNQYYFRKALWNDTPMVYLSTRGIPRRRATSPPGTTAPAEPSAPVAPIVPVGPTIFCFTNCDSVELFHDGKSLGNKRHSPGEIMTWPTDFTSGVMKAIGRRGSSTVNFELIKAAAPSRLVLLPDVNALRADGRDVSQIEVDVTDKDGVVAADAGNPITCSIAGPGRIIGIENGNLNSTEDYKSASHSAYEGRMLVYIQSLRTAGDLKLTVSSPGLEPSRATLTVH